MWQPSSKSSSLAPVGLKEPHSHFLLVCGDVGLKGLHSHFGLKGRWSKATHPRDLVLLAATTKKCDIIHWKLFV